MARLNRNISSTPARDLSAFAETTLHDVDTYDAVQTSPSAASDKENEPTPATARRDKGKGRMAPPGNLPTPNYDSTSASHSAKRRRLDNAHSVRSNVDNTDHDLDGRKYYNPDQDFEERLDVKRKSRALERSFKDNRHLYLQAGNDGLEKTITQANSIFERMKQTSDATLDSRLMVEVSQVLADKSASMLLGDSSIGLNIDQFVTKCINFMKGDDNNQDEEGALSATQRRRHQSRRADDDDDDDEAERNLDWAAFGSRACFPSNLRPPVPSFLLGPLSVQKKARTQTQRRARQTRDTGKEIRPEAITKADLGQTESNTLTVICSKIRHVLEQHCSRAEAAAEEAGELSDELMATYRVSETGGPHLFDFVVNPHSFSQTVENLFYVSFLIKEGNVGIQMDSDGLPTLLPVDASTGTERQKGSKKHQAVLSMDHETWRKLVQAFNITEPLIEHRADHSTQVSGRGWYS